MSVDPIEIGKRLEEFRHHLGVELEELAENSGINRSFLANAETGRQNPSFDFLAKLIASYTVSMDWLLTGRGEMFMRPPEHHLYRLDQDTQELLSRLYDLEDERRSLMLKTLSSVLDLG